MAELKRSPVLMLGVLILATLNLRPALTSVAPVMEQIVSDLAVDRATAGLVTTIPVLLMGLLAAAAPGLGARFGQERVITGALALIALSLGLRTLASSSFAWLLLSAFGAGAGIAVTGPLMSGFIKQHFAPRMGVAIASYSVSMTLGAALAVALALPLTHWFGGRWAWSLAVWAVPAALAFGVWWWLFPGQSLAARREARSEPLPLRSYRAWLLTLFFAAQSGIFYALTTWLVARYEQAGLSEASASGYGTLFMATGIAGAFLMPLLAARVSDRRWLLAGVTGSTCVTILLIAWLPTQLPWLVSALLGMASAGIFAVSLALPVLETESPQEAASLTSMMLTFGYLIGSVLPALLGVIRDVAGDYSLAFSVLAALALAMVIISVLMPTEQPRPSITKAEKLEAQEPS